MKKLKHIELGSVEPKFVLAVWEYPQLFIPECPIIFDYSVNATAVNVCGTERVDERIRLENLSDDIQFMRFRHETNSMYLYSPDMICFTMHYPDTEQFGSANRAILAVIFKTLNNYGIPIVHKNNDIFFCIGNMEKKCLGIMEQAPIDGWKSILFCINLKFNADLANRIFRFDTEKFTKKGEITDVGQIIGGIYEVNPNINRNKIAMDVIGRISERYDLEIEEQSLSENELSKMNELVDKFDTREWFLYGS
jgi:hypothetical protein